MDVKRMMRAGRLALRKYFVRPFAQGLVSLGVMYVGSDAFRQPQIATALAARSCDPYAWYAFGDMQALQSALVGPPDAHPERLCEDVPLSEQEQRLARELWPTQ
ncbi:DUF6059 family protein [Streptomyces xanthophaeus]|uniref:DUF6059 family protein n=1 Tax=Streptomyces xanthophaeus TaxID=67385 RepID=UPI0037111B82